MISLLKMLGRAGFRLFFSFKIKGRHHLSQAQAPYLLICNHISRLDAFLIWCYAPKELVFTVTPQSAQKKIIKFVLSFVEHLVVDVYSTKGLTELAAKLKQGTPCLLFPEGRVTSTGFLMGITEGVGVVLSQQPVPLLPANIRGEYYSKFSSGQKIFKARLFSALELSFFKPVTLPAPKAGIVAEEKQEFYRNLVYELLSDAVFSAADLDDTLFNRLLKAKVRFDKKAHIFEDINFNPLNYSKFVRATLLVGHKFKSMLGGKKKLGLMLPNTVGFCVAFYGMQAGGIIPVLINYASGVDNVLSAINTAKVEVVVTSRLFIKKAKLESVADAMARHSSIVYLEDIIAGLKFRDKALALLAGVFPRLCWRFIKERAVSEDPAVILFTSGSEARPKGVVLSHRNLLSNCEQVASRIDFSSQDVVFSSLPGFHAFGLLAGVILPAIYGLKAFQYPSPLHYQMIPSFCYQVGATILISTNAFLKNYAKRADPYEFSSLRLVVAGAEKLQEDVRQIYAERFGIRVLEGYGCTETSPVISLNTPLYNKTGSVGRILPGMDYKIMPLAGFLTGGTLQVKGPNIKLGYILSTDPGRIKPSDEWYDTGDVVTVDEHKFITIIGRQKRFVKIGGEAISLNAVEELASEIAPDHQHAALNMMAKAQGESIALYTTDKKLNSQKIARHIANTGKTPLMNPRRVEYVAEIPLLANGKVDYPRLKQLLADEV